MNQIWLSSVWYINYNYVCVFVHVFVAPTVCVFQFMCHGRVTVLTLASEAMPGHWPPASEWWGHILGWALRLRKQASWKQSRINRWFEGWIVGGMKKKKKDGWRGWDRPTTAQRSKSQEGAWWRKRQILVARMEKMLKMGSMLLIRFGCVWEWQQTWHFLCSQRNDSGIK